MQKLDFKNRKSAKEGTLLCVKHLSTIFSLKNNFTKKLLANVDKIDYRCQFHQQFMSSFYAHRFWKRKEDSKIVSPFCAFGICAQKSCSQNINEITDEFFFCLKQVIILFKIWWQGTKIFAQSILLKTLQRNLFSLQRILISLLMESSG